jgi:maltodextrin utilization protein YvdJ
MKWLFYVTYLLAALTTWLLIMVMAEEKASAARFTEHVAYLSVALAWPLLPFVILGPIAYDHWRERRDRTTGDAQ